MTAIGGRDVGATARTAAVGCRRTGTGASPVRTASPSFPRPGHPPLPPTPTRCLIIEPRMTGGRWPIVGVRGYAGSQLADDSGAQAVTGLKRAVERGRGTHRLFCPDRSIE